MVESMEKIAQLLPFVKDQQAFHAKMADLHKKTPVRSAKHGDTALKFQALIEAMEHCVAASNSAETAKKPIQLSLGLDELDGLPDDLVRELSISDGDRTDYAMLRIIEDAGGVATLDRILIGLYRQTGEVHKRSSLTSRIYRMSNKGLIFSVPGRKGVYSTRELSEAEAEALV